MSQRFKGKVALITGGNSGMGKATAKLLRSEGAQVIVTGRDPKTLAETAGELGVTAIQSDTSDLKAIDSLVREIKQKGFEHIDVVFANAGIAKFYPLENVSEETYDSLMNTNLKGVYFLVQKIVPLMTRGGTIVFNSSIGSQTGGATISVYAATKAAIRSLGRTLATELLPKGIRVNTISPGPIDTPIYGRTGGVPNGGDLLRAFTQMTPMKRSGTADEIAKAVAFLASEDSSYTVGIDLLVDGGAVEL
jgi:NAD(P)-dependent dehydrogenase (short-subunit alcohol dehydrogenase family)